MKPIIFSTPMVQAILAGRKTQTRRVLKPQPVIDAHGMWLWKDCQWMDDGLGFPASGIEDYAPYKPGDILWVRETWQHVMDDFDKCIEGTGEYYYAADGEPGFTYWVDPHTGEHKERMPWRPSIHMPREAARLFLRVTDVRAERVQDISEEDAKAEGVTAINNSQCGYRGAFRELWNTLNAKRGFDWYTNSWVWVIRFERLDTLALAVRAGAEPVYQQLLRSAT